METISLPHSQSLFATRYQDYSTVKSDWEQFFSYIISNNREYLGKMRSGRTYGCFSPFIGDFDYYNNSNTIYVSFPYCRRWYRKMVAQVNNLLEKISVEIVEERTLLGTTQVKGFNYKQLVLNKTKTQGVVNYLYFCPLIKITFSEEYLLPAVAYYGYSLITLLRMTAVSESFFPYDLTEKQIPDGNVLKYIIERNNTLLGYRTWTEYTNGSVEDLRRFNLVDNVNKSAEYIRKNEKFNRQSKIITKLRESAGGIKLEPIDENFIPEE